MKSILFTLLFCCFGLLCHSQDSLKKERIRELISLWGTEKAAMQRVELMTAAIEKANNNKPDPIWNEVVKEIKGEDLVELIIPIYNKYYTEDDINQLLEFYRTDLGKKVLSVLPLISKETTEASIEWGKILARRVIDRKKALGLIR